MDTANDPRLLVAERALQVQGSIFDHGKLKAQVPRREAAIACEQALGALRSVRYSYADPDTLRSMEPFRQVVGLANVLERLLGGEAWRERLPEEDLAVARTAWTLGLLRGLPDRLDLPATGLEAGVDAAAGRVVSATPHPGADDLLVTRVAAGRPLRVVTNDLTVQSDERVGVAVLPPSEVRGVVSEAMFLGAGEGVLRDVGSDADGRPSVPEDAWKGTRSVLSRWVKG